MQCWEFNWGVMHARCTCSPLCPVLPSEDDTFWWQFGRQQGTGQCHPLVHHLPGGGCCSAWREPREAFEWRYVLFWDVLFGKETPIGTPGAFVERTGQGDGLVLQNTRLFSTPHVSFPVKEMFAKTHCSSVEEQLGL